MKIEREKVRAFTHGFFQDILTLMSVLKTDVLKKADLEQIVKIKIPESQRELRAYKAEAMKGDYCRLSGCGIETHLSSGLWEYELISGNRRQIQRTRYSAGGSPHPPDFDPTSYCEGNNNLVCGAGAHENCLDCNSDHGFPFIIFTSPGDGLHLGFRCYCVPRLKYYEWQCPP